MESGLAESLARSDNHKYKLFQKDTWFPAHLGDVTERVFLGEGLWLCSFILIPSFISGETPSKEEKRTYH